MNFIPYYVYMYICCTVEINSTTTTISSSSSSSSSATVQGSVYDMNAKPDCLYNKQLADSAIRRGAGLRCMVQYPCVRDRRFILPVSTLTNQ